MPGIRRRLLAAYIRARSRLRAVVEEPEHANAPAGDGPGLPGGPTVVVHFGDSPETLYQVTGWLPVLERVHTKLPVTIVCRHPETFGGLAAATSLPVSFLYSYETLARAVEASPAKLVLYVNHHQLNYQMLRLRRILHIHIGHGESDKEYMASNQVKAYDFVLVAGEAAVERLGSALFGLDPARLIPVGNPQLDVASAPGPLPEITTVLYAPTFEGDAGGFRYTSLDSLGPEIVAGILASPSHRLIYRPHPIAGLRDPGVRAIDERLRADVARAGRRTPGHRVDIRTPFAELMHRAHVLVADVSAVVIDFLGTGRPFFVARPPNLEPEAVGQTALEAGYVVDAANVSRLPELVDEALASDPKAIERARWLHRHLGDVTKGASLDRFVEALETLTRRRDEWIATTARARPGS